MAVGMQDVLVVIPCLNEERHLPDLLRRLIADNPGATIVVADGGSTDRSRSIVEEHASRHDRLHLLPNPARIQSAGVNLAAARFGDGIRWLARVDAHCLYPENYILKLVAAAEKMGAGSVVVPMVSRGDGCFQRAAAAAQNSRLGTGGSPHRHVTQGQFVDHGHHALMDMALFREVSGYDERLSHNEDAELDVRLRKAGARIWLEPAAAVIYFPRSSPHALFRQYWNYGRGRATTRALHGEPLRLRQVLPLAVPTSAILALATPWFPLAALPLGTWLALCLVSGALIGGADRSSCGRLAGVAAAVMHFAWGWGFIRQTLFPAGPARQGASASVPGQSDNR